MTGDPVDAGTALAMGLVNRVVPGEEVLDVAVALAERICRNAPLAVRLSKKVVKASADVSEDEAWARSGEALAEVFASPDAREGAVAFAEKRAPRWTSR